MTRINAGVHPVELPGKLLLTEHREIIRIPNAISSGRAKLVNIPPTFRLGEGHVKFFYDKIRYLRQRYLVIHNECKQRGYNVTDFLECFDAVDTSNCRTSTIPQIDWYPNKDARNIIIERINSKGFELRQVPIIYKYICI